MSYDPKYGPDAQTSAQRAYVLQQMQATNPARYSKLSAYVTTLLTRYVDGELSWTQVQALRAAAEPRPFRTGRLEA
ncbi:hypothetical protein [Hymenobacter crusticola]|uniref:Antitoxin VbhA domain-containing protein n=1 Tax=Hymenobacter crusticola TaxID=1770526 RepID=A0A243WAL5_9BACT|nr:hypothetical protein [Hymenobacter crusticola]OUJ71389.1 hypothetical protein BXP70_21770 [Hymenobacter crusticola]